MQHKFIYLVSLILVPYQTFSQTSDYIRNGTFASDYIGDKYPPDGWSTCDYFSDPNIYDSFSSNGDPTVLPYDGSTFVMMRARGAYYLTEANHLRRTREYLAQKLVKPLEKRSCFKFSAFLAYNQYNTFVDSLEPNISFPLTLELWAGNDSCPKDTLLLTTQTIRDKNWKNYEYTFSTNNTSYSWIRLQVQWDTAIVRTKGYVYNGEMFLDLIKIWKLKGAADTIAHELYFKGDNKTILSTSSKVDFYEWTPNSNLSPNNGQAPVMQSYSPIDPGHPEYIEYTVIAGKKNECPVVETFKVLFSCDTLYPQNIIDTVYYRYFKKISLNAKEGNLFRYQWNPSLNLSSDTVRNPFIKELDTSYISYTVTIRDRYNCVFYENFIVQARCDSLVPGGSVVILDTLMEKQSNIILTPLVGQVEESSWRPWKWLQCMDTKCQSVMVSLSSDVSYIVTVSDTFNCKHNEIFNIKFNLLIPNVITPNQDNYNDRFVILGLPPGTNLKIFDKVGNLIFSAHPYNDLNWWDGTDNKGRFLETGTYWYIISNAESGLLKKGFVFLKR